MDDVRPRRKRELVKHVADPPGGGLKNDRRRSSDSTRWCRMIPGTTAVLLVEFARKQFIVWVRVLEEGVVDIIGMNYSATNKIPSLFVSAFVNDF